MEKINEVRKELKIKYFNNTDVFQAVNTTVVEFDIYLEANVYVDEYNLVYDESKYGE